LLGKQILETLMLMVATPLLLEVLIIQPDTFGAAQGVLAGIHGGCGQGALEKVEQLLVPPVVLLDVGRQVGLLAALLLGLLQLGGTLVVVLVVGIQFGMRFAVVLVVDLELHCL